MNQSHLLTQESLLKNSFPRDSSPVSKIPPQVLPVGDGGWVMWYTNRSVSSEAVLSTKQKWKPCVILSGSPALGVICQSRDPLGLSTQRLHVTGLLPLGICKPNPKRGFPFISESMRHFSSLLRMVLRAFMREKNKTWFPSCQKKHHDIMPSV